MEYIGLILIIIKITLKIMFCCNQVLDLGCKAVCDCLVLKELTAEQAGNHTIYYRYSGSIKLHQFILQDIAIGQPFYFPAPLNPYQTLKFWIEQPDSTFLTYPPTECYRLQTLPTLPAKRFTSCTQSFVETLDCVFEVAIDPEYSNENNKRLVIHTDCAIPPDTYHVLYTFGSVQTTTGFIDLSFPVAGLFTLKITPIANNHPFAPFYYSIIV